MTFPRQGTGSFSNSGVSCFGAGLKPHWNVAVIPTENARLGPGSKYRPADSGAPGATKALTAMAAIGGLVGSVLITALSDFSRKGLLAIGIIFIYGVGLISLGISEIFPVSLLIVSVVGIMASSFDALQWTLLMANVPDDMRGRAMGGWIFAIGFGWAGSLELGLIAEVYSVSWALSVNGIGLLILGVAALMFAGRLRRA